MDKTNLNVGDDNWQSEDSEDNIDSEDSALDITFEGEDLFEDDLACGITEKIVAVHSDNNPIDRGNNDEEYQSDSLRSITSDSEDESTKKFSQPLFSLLKDMKNMKWQAGLVFKSKEAFKDAVITYAVHSGVGIKLLKNDNQRVRFRCKPGCEWKIFAAPMKDKDTWQVRNVKDEHTCSREFQNKLLSAKWLSKRIESKIREQPNIQVSKIVDKVKEKWVAGITKSKAFRAKAKASILVEGCVGEQYNHLNHYCKELQTSNYGSSVFLKFVWPPQHSSGTPTTSRQIIPRFQRLYVCLTGCRESFKLCRPFVGLDGCFMKGPYGGQLLTAIGRDPNDQMLPIAYAIVEVENKDSWTWFLSNLIRDIGDVGITYISDQQKGLVQTFKELFPQVDHRFCVRHLYNNFRKKFPSKNLKLLLWRASNATYEAEWIRTMQEIHAISHAAYDHLIGIDRALWCKHAFSGLPRCDVVVNNMSETFNRVILDMRDKPILTMCEDIRIYLMRRWATIRERIEKQSSDVNPKIAKKVADEAKHSGMWMPLWSSNRMFEVIHQSDKFVVDLDKWFCSCGKWRVSGLPCRYAISCIYYLNMDVHHFVPDNFKVSIYRQCYMHRILPTNGPNFWPKLAHTEILPPTRRRAPGRPKKKRNMDANDEGSQTKLGRKHGVIKCSKCGILGHNKRSCQNFTT